MKSVRLFPMRTFAFYLLVVAGVFFASQTLRATPTFTYNDPNKYIWQESISPYKVNTSSRTYARYVLEEYATAQTNNTAVNTSNVLSALKTLASMQDLSNPPDFTYGNFGWSGNDVPPQTTQVNVSDPNAGEFIVECLTETMLRFKALVNQDSDIANAINAILAPAETGIINDTRNPSLKDMDVAYTNMYLTRTWNLVSIGQVLNHPNTIQIGRTCLNKWLTQTQTYGVNEYLSPTYYGTDLDALGFLCMHAADEQIASQAQQAYKLFWIDLYANWLNQDQHLGGQHSRTYDFLRDSSDDSAGDTDGTDRYFYAAGLEPNYVYGFWLGMDEVALHMPAFSDVPGIIPGSPLTIVRNFNTSSTTEAFTTNYINVSPEYSVGSGAQRYDDPTSEALTITLPGDDATTSINFNTEGRGDYYLQNDVPGNTTVTKAITLRPYIASVQKAGEVLFLASTDGRSRSTGKYDPTTSCVESSIIFPTAATVYVGANQVTVSEKTPIDVPAGSTVFFKLNGVATGIRFLASTKLNTTPTQNGTPVDLTLTADDKSPTYGAMRITCVHCAGTASDPLPAITAGNDPRAYIALWARTQAVSDDPNASNAFTKFCSDLMTTAASCSYSNGTVTLTASGHNNNTLQVAANINTEAAPTLGGYESVQSSTAHLNVGGIEMVSTQPTLTVPATQISPTTLQTWVPSDVGTVGKTGTSSENSSNVFTVTGAGSDVWGKVDSFQFCHQQLTGDGWIVARLTNLPTSAQTWAKVGVMLRDSLAAGAMNAFVYQTPGTTAAPGNGQRFNYRVATNGDSTRASNAVQGTSTWLRVVRSGNSFTAFTAPDTTANADPTTRVWTQIGTAITIPMGPTVYAGLALTSFDPNNTLTVDV